MHFSISSRFKRVLLPFVIRRVPLAACLPVPINLPASSVPERYSECTALARADKPPVAPINFPLKGFIVFSTVLGSHRPLAYTRAMAGVSSLSTSLATITP